MQHVKRLSALMSEQTLHSQEEVSRVSLKGLEVSPPPHPLLCVPPTRCGGLRDGLVDAGAEAAADGDVAGRVVGLPTLVPQLLLPPPLCSSV